MKPTNFPGRLKARKSEVLERQTESEQLTPKQKLAKLDSRLGKGVGSVKERARLQKLLKTVTTEPTTTVEVVVEPIEAVVPTDKPKRTRKSK